MPIKPTGNVRKHSEGYSARVRIGPNERPSFALFAHGDDAAKERAALLADLAKRMRLVASAAEIQIILDAAGRRAIRATSARPRRPPSASSEGRH
jgi:hypothetical protein